MRQADTARDVYRDDILPTLESRQQFVRDHLRAYIEQHDGEAPTALELLAFVQARWPGRPFDVNTIRPRLTAMNDMHMVRMDAKRRCRISGKRVYTWALDEPRQAAEREPQPQAFTF